MNVLEINECWIASDLIQLVEYKVISPCFSSFDSRVDSNLYFCRQSWRSKGSMVPSFLYLIIFSSRYAVEKVFLRFYYADSMCLCQWEIGPPRRNYVVSFLRLRNWRPDATDIRWHILKPALHSTFSRGSWTIEVISPTFLYAVISRSSLSLFPSWCSSRRSSSS